MKRIRLIAMFLLLNSIFFNCGKKSGFQSYFPITGKKALYQRSLDLRSNLNVLTVSTRPGFEDLAALAYFRLGQGANIMSAYVTNGEAGESDQRVEYPAYLGYRLRKQAFEALTYLDGEAYFLNMPDIVAARDSATVRMKWSSDSLQARLTQLISQFKPDVILVNSDPPTWQGNVALYHILLNDVLTVVHQLSRPDTPVKKNHAGAEESWIVRDVFIHDNQNGPYHVPVNEKHPMWKKSYREIGTEAGSKYRSFRLQRKDWFRGFQSNYRLVYSYQNQPVTGITENLMSECLQGLQGLQLKITRLTEQTLKGHKKGVMPQLVAIMDSVTQLLVPSAMMAPCVRRVLLDWNLGLESLRCSLLGVQVKYTISDTSLAPRQLTYLTIDEVKGVSDSGKTEIFFGTSKQNWIINEDVKQRLPLTLHEAYRIVSPSEVTFTYPPGAFKESSHRFNEPFFFFILHHAATRAQSFVYRARIHFTFTPRFVVEITPPIIPMRPGEKVFYRLTNQLYDGVRDTVEVHHSLASSWKSVFRLNQKGSSHFDSLLLVWEKNPGDGTYKIPLSIDETVIGNFAARKFTVRVDSSKKVGVVVSLPYSPLPITIQRLGLPLTRVRLERNVRRQLDTLDVLILDRRLLSFQPGIRSFKPTLQRFVRQGGHLIILAQDASVWNDDPLWEGLQMQTTLNFDENIPVKLSEENLLREPNRITAEDWTGWLFRRAYNKLRCWNLTGVSYPVRAGNTGDPLIVMIPAGKGKVTYVDLALTPQLLNIHPGAFRLLANIISN